MAAQMDETEKRAWERAASRTAEREPHYWGSAWGRWGIRPARGRRYVVYLIGGARLIEFNSLGCARLFCEAIDG